MRTSPETSLLHSTLESALGRPEQLSLWDRWARGAVVRRLAGMQSGELNQIGRAHV